MRIVRFLDPDGRESLGTPTENGVAKWLRGDLYQGLETKGEQVQIRALLAPVVPTNVFCIGLNYKAHAEETGASVAENPVVFMKPTSAFEPPGSPHRHTREL